MAPEMLVHELSDKSDVYSYGMTLLELVGGRKNYNPSPADDSSPATPDLSRDFFPNIVREKMERGRVMEAVDAAMAAAREDEKAVEAVVAVALRCIQHRRETRPSMQTVVDMLLAAVPPPPPPPENRRPSSAAAAPLSTSLTHGR
uniref:Protein kinase domain-containing protein n=1 Tax=Oryza brachyantha TaxID=4533 RepID=J3MWT7_ORYBR